MKKSQNKQGGFTIIEVVLVLAIAGLIFMVVFLALPGLQRSQRDTQRKQDIGRFVSQITTFQGNNKGALPCAGDSSDGDDTSTADCLEPVKAALEAGGSSFKDPSKGLDYVLRYDNSVSSTAFGRDGYILGVVHYSINASCLEGGEGIDFNSENPGSIAIAMKLEDGMVYCQQG